MLRLLAPALLMLPLLAGCMRIERYTPADPVRDDPPFDIEIQRHASPGDVTIAVTAGADGYWEFSPGQDSPPADLLTVRLIDADSGEPAKYPISGTHTIEDRTLAFRPDFQLTPGSSYLLRLDSRHLPDADSVSRPPLELRFPVDDSTIKRNVPFVTSIFPTAGELPANHLKFYLHFSRPMRRGDVFEHLSLLDSDGDPVLEPFREVELWADDGRRLTVWLHPGRQKQGVNLNVEFGPVLEAGKQYRLHIDRTLESEAGTPLGLDYQKVFTVEAADHRQPDIADWSIVPPAAGGTRPLVVRFPESLDSALLESALDVKSDNGASVPGVIETGPGEKSWRFIPSTPWQAGPHHLVAKGFLEDLAGNSLERPFEDTFDPNASPENKDRPFKREFLIRAPETHPPRD